MYLTNGNMNESCTKQV